MVANSWLLPLAKTCRVRSGNTLGTKTNYSGGIQGGTQLSRRSSIRASCLNPCLGGQLLTRKSLLSCLAGISNGEPIVFRVAFKPPATIGVPQQTVDYYGECGLSVIGWSVIGWSVMSCALSGFPLMFTRPQNTTCAVNHVCASGCLSLSCICCSCPQATRLS